VGGAGEDEAELGREGPDQAAGLDLEDLDIQEWLEGRKGGGRGGNRRWGKVKRESG
jgi:hypothetical protein